MTNPATQPPQPPTTCAFQPPERENTYRGTIPTYTSPSSSPSKIQANNKGNVIDFKNDKSEDMTRGRRIALYLMNKSWYNPGAAIAVAAAKQKEKDATDKAEATASSSDNSSSDNNNNHDGNVVAVVGKEERQHDRHHSGTATEATTSNTTSVVAPPSLEKAWGYFEHVALSRYIARDDDEDEKASRPKKNILTRIIRKYSKGNKKLERAEPGENHIKTKLYDPIFTPHKQVSSYHVQYLKSSKERSTILNRDLRCNLEGEDKKRALCCRSLVVALPLSTLRRLPVLSPFQFTLFVFKDYLTVCMSVFPLLSLSPSCHFEHSLWTHVFAFCL